MRILAIDASAKEFSVALLENKKLVFSEAEGYFVGLRPSKRGSASLLIPAIRHGLETVNWRPADLELLAVTIGPGSFTGLRVGVVTAKSLAYVHQTPLVAVNTLEVLAAQAIQGLKGKPDIHRVNAVINAQRQQLFSARFSATADDLVKKVGSTEIVDRDSWVENLEAGETVTGNGLRPLVEQLGSERQDVVVAPREFWDVTAAAVGRIALTHFRNGRRDDPWSLVPEYYRPSAAEEKANLNFGD